MTKRVTNREREGTKERVTDRVTNRERESMSGLVTEQGREKDGKRVGAITIQGLHQGEGIGRKVESKEEQQVEKENQENEEGSMRRALGIT